MSDSNTYYCADCDSELILTANFTFAEGQTVTCPNIVCSVLNYYNKEEDDFNVYDVSGGGTLDDDYDNYDANDYEDFEND
jgi:hypothetical protein